MDLYRGSVFSNEPILCEQQKTWQPARNPGQIQAEKWAHDNLYQHRLFFGQFLWVLHVIENAIDGAVTVKWSIYPTCSNKK